MEPLLRTIAREYTKRYKDLKQICFLFPNKRCGTFLRKYFAEFDIHTEDLPHIHTISELTAQVARKTEAGRIIQLFTLYNSYIELLGEEDKEDTIVEFDSFRMWGETVIADFNTVDLNLADPDEIFKNVKDYREITSDFLTEEQREVMREYFNIEPGEESDSFWKQFDSAEDITELKHKFLNLWQILAPLHKKFISRLEEKGFGTTGSIYRDAAEKVSEKGREVFPYKKIIAVGFNALTESERLIFKALRDSDGYEGFDDFCDFIWDSYGPIFESEMFTASRFVDFNKKHFPTAEWFSKIIDAENEEWKKNAVQIYPHINIVSAPSNTSQTKVAAEILKENDEKEIREMIDNAEVALILPDESLLPNMLYSLPDELNNINLTMGLSLRHSSIAGFMSLLRRMYVSMSERNDEKIFYVKDLKIFLTHPFSYRLLQPAMVEKLIAYIDGYHLVTVKANEIEEFIPDSKYVFNLPSKKEKGYNIFRYLEKLFSELIQKLKEESEELNTADLAEVEIYKEYIESLEETMEEFNIKGVPLSILSLVNRLISSEKVGFEGEPLVGLQVMGTLETRCLDFKNIIILSMNEGVMPRRQFSATFLPESLRKVYGLPPARYAEEIFAYYFYRLISRAKEVTLIYDGRTVSGMRGGESRYLLQLKQYYPKEFLTETAWQFHLDSRKPENLTVVKTPDITNLLGLYMSQGEEKKNLSASALNNFRECGVKFFLQNVLNINSDPEKSEYIDAISIGNVVHDVMQKLYLTPKEFGKFLTPPKSISHEYIEQLLADSDRLKDEVKQSIRSLYYGEKVGNTENKRKIHSGVMDIVSEQIEDLVRTILRYDLKLTPFKLYGCEIKRKFSLKLSNGREVNFNFAIDRLDEIEFEGEKRLRIVDYKTGKLKLKAKDLAEVFAGGYSNEQIFQLFTYAWLLGHLGFPGWENVITEIYYMPALDRGEPSLPQLENAIVTSYKPYSEEFNELMEKMINEIFDSEEFFFPVSNSACTYCGFKNYCKR